MARRRPRGEDSAHREQRRTELLRVSADLIADKGFAKTTVRDIGDAADLLSGSLYYYFDSKEEIVEQLMQRLLDFLWTSYADVVASDAAPREKLAGIIRVSMQAMDLYNSEVRIFQNESQLMADNERFHAMAAKSEDFQAMVTGLLVAGGALKEFRQDMHVDVVFRFIRDSMWPIVHWYRPGGELGIDQVVDDYLTMLFDGVAPRP